jgi:hypothetical protein
MVGKDKDLTQREQRQEKRSARRLPGGGSMDDFMGQVIGWGKVIYPLPLHYFGATGLGSMRGGPIT